MSGICITTRVTMRGRMTIRSSILAGTRLPAAVRPWEVISFSKMTGPVKLFVPLARLKSTAEDVAHFTGEYRVDLHPRFSRDGRKVCIDSTYEGLGRQMYVIDIGYILDHPPNRQASVR